MIICLHLGAHKTATTYMQHALEQSREQLAARGIAYPSLPDVRAGLTDHLGIGEIGLTRTANDFLAPFRHCNALIISDENLIGGVRPKLHTFYPTVSWRLRRLSSVLRGHDIRVFLATRSYAPFISSMYCEYIRGHQFRAPESYLDAVNFKRFSWLRVIGAARSALPSSPMLVWKYEDFDQVGDQVFDAITLGNAHLVERPAERLRPSLSDQAVKALAKCTWPRTRAEIRSLVSSTATAHPIGPSNPPFCALDSDTAERLHQRYLDEMSALGLNALCLRPLGT